MPTVFRRKSPSGSVCEQNDQAKRWISFRHRGQASTRHHQGSTVHWLHRRLAKYVRFPILSSPSIPRRNCGTTLSITVNPEVLTRGIKASISPLKAPYPLGFIASQCACHELMFRQTFRRCHRDRLTGLTRIARDHRRLHGIVNQFSVSSSFQKPGGQAL